VKLNRSNLLQPVDAGWLMLETPETPSHVGALLIFSKPAGAATDYLRQLVNRWREPGSVVAPPWNRRLRRGRMARWLPGWEIDPAFDLDYHFRHSALPLPGGERELGVLVSRLHSHPLDMSRPLWELHVIEGLSGDRFAIYAKLHHSVIDGVGGMRLLLRGLSEDPRDRRLFNPWSIGPQALRPRAHPAAAATPRSLHTAAEILRAFGELMQAARDPAAALAAPFTAPRSVLGEHINAQRRFATQQYDLVRLRRICRLAHCTLNDMVLYLSSSALRRFLLEREELPTGSLTAGIAVNLREADDQSAGNAISFLIVRLATDVADPLARLQAIRRSSEAGKAHLRSLPREALTPYTVLSGLPYALSLFSGLAPYIRPPSSVNISNIPGPTQPMYVAGSKLEAIYPMSMLFHGSALNITCISYVDTLNFGFTGARDTLPSLQKLAVYMGEAVEEIANLLEPPAPGPVQTPANHSRRPPRPIRRARAAKKEKR
jgi:diacylglycerol O-acyltransferase